MGGTAALLHAHLGHRAVSFGPRVDLRLTCPGSVQEVSRMCSGSVREASSLESRMGLSLVTSSTLPAHFLDASWSLPGRLLDASSTLTGRWDPATSSWKTEGITEASFEVETRTISFLSSRLTSLASHRREAQTRTDADAHSPDL